MQSQNNGRGKLYIVGTGPGDRDQLTQRAIDAVCESEYIIGNNFYIKLIEPYIRGKTVIRSSMGKEVKRAQKCIELAGEHVISMVSGGDPGVYGMASIVLEVLEREGSDIEVEVIPGVTAATAAASRIGSPLSGDYVTISLSDLLTPLEVIQHRLELAFQMDVPVVIYNPKSRGRPHNLSLALDIAIKHLSGKTPVAVVKNAFRDGEKYSFSTLNELREDNSFVDMHSLVIIGGTKTKFWRVNDTIKGLITSRGYDRKYVY